jgi:hypothetical protein
MSTVASALTPQADRAQLGSRAVLRRVEAGCIAVCAHCGEQVKFAAKQARFQAIANVYVDGRWSRVEHFHQDCYGEAGEPYGQVSEQDIRPRRASA